MSTIRTGLRLSLFAGVVFIGAASIQGQGLIPVAGGLVVYDSNQGVCWLADANLAGEPGVPAYFGVTGVNPDGTMDYPTAMTWVKALNHHNGGAGYLGHLNWQLPDTPLVDTTCSSDNNGNFGVSCTGSALGKLYNVGLSQIYPNSVVPDFTNFVGPFRNLQPGLYWTADSKSNAQYTFSFNTGLSGTGTKKYNFFHVLAMTPGPIGTPPTGTGLLAYTSGPAANKAVYDAYTGYSWAMDANLAATDQFGVTGTVTITSSINMMTYVVPRIDADGAMLFESVASKKGWLAGMNAGTGYAGTATWVLPHLDDLQKLYKHLGFEPGALQLKVHGYVGPFLNLQPGFYWSCERDPGNNQSACDFSLNPAPGYMYSFNFDDGFEATDLTSKELYVMVYYPATELGCSN